jgi:hypothetical protein
MHDPLQLQLVTKWLGQVEISTKENQRFELNFLYLFQGYEEYQNCKLEFLDIPNIHAMRNSLSKLRSACESGTLSGAKVDDRLKNLIMGNILISQN